MCSCGPRRRACAGAPARCAIAPSSQVIARLLDESACAPLSASTTSRAAKRPARCAAASSPTSSGSCWSPYGMKVRHRHPFTAGLVERDQRLRPHRPQRLPRRPRVGADIEIVAVNDITDTETLAPPAQVRLGLRAVPGHGRGRRRRARDRRPRGQGARREGPGRAAVGRPRRRRRDRVDRLLHQARRRRQAPRGRRQEGDHLRARRPSRT